MSSRLVQGSLLPGVALPLAARMQSPGIRLATRTALSGRRPTAAGTRRSPTGPTPMTDMNYTSETPGYTPDDDDLDFEALPFEDGEENDED